MLTVSFALKQIIGKSIVFCAVYKSYVYTGYATLASGVTGISYESLISSWYRDEPLADCVHVYQENHRHHHHVLFPAREIGHCILSLTECLSS